MKWIIRTYALILLAYTGWRTWDFMTAQLPAGNISLWLPLLFLFATEAGLILWHEVSMNHSSTHQQQQISTALTWLDFVGSLAAGVADMIIRQTLDASYTIPPLLRDLLIYGLPALVDEDVHRLQVAVADVAGVGEGDELRIRPDRAADHRCAGAGYSAGRGPAPDLHGWQEGHPDRPSALYLRGVGVA